MFERPIVLIFKDGEDCLAHEAIIDSTTHAPFDHAIDILRTGFVGLISDLCPSSDDAALVAFVSKLRFTWNRPMGDGETRTSRIPSDMAFNAFWKYVLDNPDLKIEIFASAPFHDIPSNPPMDVNDMPLRGSTPTPAPAPAPTPPSKQAPVPPATAKTEPRTPSGFHSASSVDSPAASAPEAAEGPPAFVPDTSASVSADDDPPPLWSRPAAEVNVLSDDSDPNDSPGLHSLRLLPSIADQNERRITVIPDESIPSEPTGHGSLRLSPFLADQDEHRINVITDASIPSEPPGLGSLHVLSYVEELDERRISIITDDLNPSKPPMDLLIAVSRFLATIWTRFEPMPLLTVRFQASLLDSAFFV